MEIFESFDQFINYDDINLDLKEAKLNLLNNISRHDKKYKDVIDFIIESNLVNEVYSLNEIDLQKSLDNKVDSIKDTVKDKGKKALSITQQKIIKIGTNVKQYIGNVIKIIKKELAEAIGKIRKHTQKVVKSSQKIKKAIAENKDKKEFQEEVVHFKDMYGKGIAWAKKDPMNALQKSMQKKSKMEESLEIFIYEALSEALDTGEITIDILIEQDAKGQPKIPFLKKMVDGLRNIPPFKQLWDFGKYAEKVGRNALHKASVFLNKTAGATGPWKYPDLGTIVGIGLEIVARKPLQLGLIAAIPPLGIVLTTVTTLETGATVVSLIS